MLLHPLSIDHYQRQCCCTICLIDHYQRQCCCTHCLQITISDSAAAPTLLLFRDNQTTADKPQYLRCMSIWVPRKNKRCIEHTYCILKLLCDFTRRPARLWMCLREDWWSFFFLTNLMHKFFILIHLLYSSTCFEHYCAHLQEDNCISTAFGFVTLFGWLFSTQVTGGLSPLVACVLNSHLKRVTIPNAVLTQFWPSEYERNGARNM